MRIDLCRPILEVIMHLFFGFPLKTGLKCDRSHESNVPMGDQGLGMEQIRDKLGDRGTAPLGSTVPRNAAKTTTSLGSRTEIEIRKLEPNTKREIV